MLDVVLEVMLRAAGGRPKTNFNPCCAGCSSGSVISNGLVYVQILISILVVLDVVLEEAGTQSDHLFRS